MSSPSSAASQQPRIWPTVAPYLIPPFAASAAIIPVFYGFKAKSALQLGDKIPRLAPIIMLKEGCMAAPTIGFIVGTQLVAQRLFEKILAQGENKQPSFSTMILSSMLVGGISAPALAVFNGQTMGRSILESLKALTLKQTGAIVSRETSFLFSLRISEPISETLKSQLGDHQAVKLTALFASGAIGSLVGHPADTALTLWQKEKKVTSLRQTMNGAAVKAITVGLFAIAYHSAKEQLEVFLE
jgi:hypothetical protein